MTRGTAFLLLDDVCLESVEFNGEMYPEGYGDMFFEQLKKVKDRKDFEKFISEFNKSSFGYEYETLIYKIEKVEMYDVITKDELIIDFNYKYFERFGSDWIFFKNLTGTFVKFLTKGKEENHEVTIFNGDSYRFNYGRIEED